MPPRKLQPAVLGGVFLGTLSALPFINLANCCCLWIVGGGIIAAYLMQQNHPAPVTAGDGAIVGLLAGLFGAFVWVAVSLPIHLMTGPIQARLMERMLENARDIPDALRVWVESMRYGGGAALQMALGFLFMIFTGMIFSTLGGILGAVLFKRDLPPPAPTVEVLPPEPPRL